MESIFSEIAGWTTIFAKDGQELIASGFIKTINKIFNFIAGNSQIKIRLPWYTSRLVAYNDEWYLIHTLKEILKYCKFSTHI